MTESEKLDYIIKALEQGQEALEEAVRLLQERDKEIAELRIVISEAADEIEAWGAYADEYFKEKHDLRGVVSEFRSKALSSQPQKGE